MIDNFDILAFAGLSQDRPWELKHAEPTDLRAVVTSRQCPTAEEVCQAIATYIGETIDAKEVDPTEPDIPWSLLISIDGLPEDIVAWTEPLNETTKEAAQVKEGWIIAVQTVLHSGDPLTHFSNVMQILTGANLGVHSICDVATGRWFPRSTMETLFVADAVEPPEEMLWITRLVESPSNVEPEERWAWITTHGLSRCGRVELEMVGVPALLSEQAIQLVDGLAALTLETPLPPAGKTLSLGSQLLVSLMPCEEAVNMLQSDMPGREDRPFHSVVIASPEGTSVYPEDALQKLQGGDTTVLKTLRSTTRCAALARNQWDVFIRAAKSIGDNEHATCMVKIPWSYDSDEQSPREYLWFRIVEVNQRTVIGELAHTPQLVTSLSEGHRETVRCQDITDWIVITPIGPLGPTDAEAIDEFLDQFIN